MLEEKKFSGSIQKCLRNLGITRPFFISGLFLYPVPGRIPDRTTGYPVIKKAGYPAYYAAEEKHLNTAYNILQSFDFM